MALSAVSVFNCRSAFSSMNTMRKNGLITLCYNRMNNNSLRGIQNERMTSSLALPNSSFSPNNNSFYNSNSKQISFKIVSRSFGSTPSPSISNGTKENEGKVIAQKIEGSTSAPVSTESQPILTVVHHPYSLDDKPLEVGDNVKDRFAIVEFSGTQFKVTLDDVIIADKISGVDIGDIINLDKVLLIGSKKSTIIGRPYVTAARVVASVEEIAKDKKVIAFKMRRRKNSQSKTGFRRQVTVLRVNEIIVDNSIEHFGLEK